MSGIDRIKEIGAAAAKKASEVLHTSAQAKTSEASSARKDEAPKAEEKKEKADTVNLSRETGRAEKTADSKLGDVRKNFSWLGGTSREAEKKNDEASESPSEKGSAILDSIRDKGGDALGFIKDKGEDALGFVNDKGGDIKDGLTDALNSAKTGLEKAGDGARNIFNTVDTALNSIPQIDAAAYDLASDKNNELTPKGNTEPPRPLMEDGKLKVTSWNLHHGLDPDNKNNQVDQMTDKMRDAKSDVYALQEVPPWEAQKIADEMGMNAYYSRTAPNQGNMILVNPDLKVEGNEKMTVNGDIRQGDVFSAYSALGKHMTAGSNEDKQKAEPRIAQVLKVKTPDGKSTTLWNTHLTSTKDSDFRKNEVDKITDYLNTHTQPGDRIIGGGDLNSGPNDPATEELRKRGFDTKGASIDWIAGKNLGGPLNIVSNSDLYDQNGVQISDHPMVTVEI